MLTYDGDDDEIKRLVEGLKVAMEIGDEFAVSVFVTRIYNLGYIIGEVDE